MVKALLGIILLFSTVFAQEIDKHELLINKIKTFITPAKFEKNKAYINIIFSPEDEYFIQDRLDSVKIVQNLKENGLLNLFFKKPQELELSFKTNSSPLFFVKLIGDSLRSIGYYRYVTHSSSYNNSEFKWTITMLSEYATDPMILNKELSKRGSVIVDIVRNSANSWEYSVDISNAHLIVKKLDISQEITLKRSLYAYWLDVSGVMKLKILSSNRNDWHPYITYYDNSLHLLKVIKKSDKTRYISLKIPQSAKYIKISDLYTLKNVKEPLILKSF